jgi:hypothetical protein
VAHPRPAAEAERTGRVPGDGVDVRDAVQHLHQHLPERRVDDEHQRRLQRVAEDQDGERDERHRRDRPQELDRRGGELAEDRRGADREADHDAGDDGDDQPDEPAGDGVADRGPERLLADEVAQRAGDLRERRQVLGLDDAEPRQQLEHHDEGREAERAQERAGTQCTCHRPGT